jgi:hypothetical protein
MIIVKENYQTTFYVLQDPDSLGYYFILLFYLFPYLAFTTSTLIIQMISLFISIPLTHYLSVTTINHYFWLILSNPNSE